MMPALEAFALIFTGVALVIVAAAIGSASSVRRKEQTNQQVRPQSRRIARSLAFLVVLVGVIAMANTISPISRGVTLAAAAISQISDVRGTRLASVPARGQSVTVGPTFVEVHGVEPHETTFVSFVRQTHANNSQDCAPETCAVLRRVVQSVRNDIGAQPVAASIFPVTANDAGVARTTIPADVGVNGPGFANDGDKLRIVVATQHPNGRLMILSTLRPEQEEQGARLVLATADAHEVEAPN